MATYEQEILHRAEDLKRKRDALKRAMAEKIKIIESFRPEDHEEDREAYLKTYGTVYDAILEIIQTKTKDIANEVTELESFERRTRFARWGRWWNLWIFGWIAAGLVAIFEVLASLARSLLQVLNNPEKMLAILERIIDRIDATFPSPP